MSWEEFCRMNASEIGPRYRQAHKSRISIPDDDLGPYRLKIEKIARAPRSLLLLGPAGRGKTYFMFALMRELFDTGVTSLGNLRFFRSTTLDNKMVEEFEKWKTIDYFVKSLAELDFLFIDDFGLDRETSKAERDYYDLIDRRVSFDKITVFSSNLDEKSIKKLFGERISSRLKSCVKIEFNGPDLRESIRI